MSNVDVRIIELIAPKATFEIGGGRPGLFGYENEAATLRLQYGASPTGQVVYLAARNSANTFTADQTVQGTMSATTLKGTGLTSGRVAIVGTNGVVTDSVGLLYSLTGSTVSALTIGDGSAGGTVHYLSRPNSGNAGGFSVLRPDGTLHWSLWRTSSGQMSMQNFDVSGQAIDAWCTVADGLGGVITLGGSAATKRGVNFTGNVQVGGTPRITSGGAATFVTVVASSLTVGRIVRVGASGQLADDAGLIYTQTSGVTTAVTVGDGGTSADVGVIVNGKVGYSRSFVCRTAGITRWSFGCDNSAESGSDAGSNLFITARTDAGAVVDSVLTAVRASGGLITIGGTTSRITEFTGVVRAPEYRVVPDGAGIWFFDSTRIYKASSGGLRLRSNSSNVRPMFEDSTGTAYTIWDAGNLPVSTFAKTVLDDADAATFRATIGAVDKGGDTISSYITYSGPAGGGFVANYVNGAFPSATMTASVRAGALTLGRTAGADEVYMSMMNDAGNSMDHVRLWNVVSGGEFWFDNPVNLRTTVLKVSGTQVVGARSTGWTAWSGTASKASRTTRTVVAASASYVQAESTAMMQDIQYAHQAIKAISDALIAHGLIGA